jgi:hypothetical protein
MELPDSAWTELSMDFCGTLGIPNIEKILSSNGITDFVDTVVKVSSTGYLEYSYIATIMYCLFGYGPQKSMLNSVHALSGNSIKSHCIHYTISHIWIR